MENRDVETLFSRMDQLARRTPSSFERFLAPLINWQNRLIGIRGARGCGKTTLIRQHVRKTFGGVSREALYVSLDDFWFATHSLEDLVEWHINQGGTHLFLDEIHYLDDWQRHLKNIYDFHPELNVVYTGSSMLRPDREGADLSRRQRVYEMPGFSFREYLNYELGTAFEAHTLDDILSSHREIAAAVAEKVRVLSAFKDYLKRGFYPFYKEDPEGYAIRLREVVKLVLEVDLPKTEDIRPATIVKARKMLSILAASMPQTPRMAALYRELETDRNQGLKLLRALAEAGLLQLLSSERATLKNMSRPDKIYLDNANLFYALAPAVDTGCIRELFFLNQLRAAGHDVAYPKQGDFLVDGHRLFEVGGKGKSFDQIKDIPDSYIAYDDVEVGQGNKIPLWLFGFMY